MYCNTECIFESIIININFEGFGIDSEDFLLLYCILDHS